MPVKRLRIKGIGKIVFRASAGIALFITGVYGSAHGHVLIGIISMLLGVGLLLAIPDDVEVEEAS